MVGPSSKGSDESPPGNVSVRGSTRISWIQRLREFRRSFQPVVDHETSVEWEQVDRFRYWKHHRRYRGFLKYEYNVKLPKKGRIYVYACEGKYAVKHEGVYYVIHWER